MMSFSPMESYAAIAALHDFLCAFPSCDGPELVRSGVMSQAEMTRLAKNALVFLRDRAASLDCDSAIGAQVVLEWYLGADAAVAVALRRIWERSPLLADVVELQSLLSAVAGRIQKNIAIAQAREKFRIAQLH